MSVIVAWRQSLMSQYLYRRFYCGDARSGIRDERPAHDARQYAFILARGLTCMLAASIFSELIYAIHAASYDISSLSFYVNYLAAQALPHCLLCSDTASLSAYDICQV